MPWLFLENLDPPVPSSGVKFSLERIQNRKGILLLNSRSSLQAL